MTESQNGIYINENNPQFQLALAEFKSLFYDSQDDLIEIFQV